MVVDAGPEGLTVEAAGGKKTKLAWDKVEASDAFRIALEMPLPEAADAKARHHIFLAQLATLAGKAARAAELRLKAATFHFQDEIGKDAPEGAKALYDAARALVDERSASPLEKESDRDALALDILHLARLASAAGMESDSADYAARAVALDPTLEEEAAGGATKGLDRWLLENESWAWDPDDMNRADAQTANDLAGDALLDDRLADQPLGQVFAFAAGQHPANHIAAEDVENHVEVEVGPLRGPQQLGDVP